MADTVAGCLTLVEQIDLFIAGKMTAGDIKSFVIGAKNVELYSLDELLKVRKYYAGRMDALGAGTEYFDHFDQEDSRTGADGIEYIGDDD